MTTEKLNKIDVCRHLLPEPGAEVAGELIAELRKHRELLQECHDYLKARNLGEPAEELLVKCGQMLAGYNSANDEMRDRHLKQTPPEKETSK